VDVQQLAIRLHSAFILDLAVLVGKPVFNIQGKINVLHQLLWIISVEMCSPRLKEHQPLEAKF